MNVFTQSITRAYDLTDATWEIIIMLLVAFILGWLFNYFWNKVADPNIGTTGTSIPKKYLGMTQDDLKIIEGIGPKIEELLKASGIKTWSDVASSEVDALKNILTSGGDRFQMHDPASWADQAALAVEGKWTELEEYQDLLIGGRS